MCGDIYIYKFFFFGPKNIIQNTNVSGFLDWFLTQGSVSFSKSEAAICPTHILFLFLELFSFKISVADVCAICNSFIILWKPFLQFVIIVSLLVAHRHPFVECV